MFRRKNKVIIEDGMPFYFGPDPLASRQSALGYNYKDDKVGNISVKYQDPFGHVISFLFSEKIKEQFNKIELELRAFIINDKKEILIPSLYEFVKRGG